MSEIEQIGKQLQRSFEGKAWHGPSVQEVLAGVSAQMAAAPSPGGAHRIWDIVAHMATWKGAVAHWLAGDRSRPTDADDWRQITDTSAAAWQQTLDELRTAHEQLAAEVKKLSDDRLRERLWEGMPSIYTVLHGIVQHDLYHAGQIAILKKMLGTGSS
jgi:uncharacterized damage-inducible protein DinB